MELFAETLQSAIYVVTTCSNAADQLLRANTSPKIVIIDEAGVAKETEALLAILHNLSSVVMIIFLGDHNQLHPTVISLRIKLVRDDPTSRFSRRLVSHTSRHRHLWASSPVSARLSSRGSILRGFGSAGLGLRGGQFVLCSIRLSRSAILQQIYTIGKRPSSS